MALDVHWGIQQIYNHLFNEYSINSFNDNGFAIESYIHYGTTNEEKDNALYNLAEDVLAFGDGAVKFRPVSSLDAVAHELDMELQIFKLDGHILVF